MSELGQVVQLLGRMRLTLLKNPSGTYHFVGRVPKELAISGTPQQIADAARFGIGFVKGASVRTFLSAEDAIAAAAALGYEVADVRG